MRRKPRRKAETVVTTLDRESKPIIEAVAEILKQNPLVLQGYLVVGFRIDGTVAISHNSCCVPHVVNRTIDQVKKYPDLAKPREKYRESHDR
jgi:phosphoribosyl 1,2-cyclic phosphodiesterase